MKVILLLAAFFSFHTYSYGNDQTNAANSVTYNFSGGRFGDNLIAYMHAKWISFKYGLPLYYKPFDYSELLVLHKNEMIYHENILKLFKNEIAAINDDPFEKPAKTPTLYIIPFFPECLDELKKENATYFTVDWEDKGFQEILKAMIKPLNPVLSNHKVPEDRITVAVHVREGGHIDQKKAYKSWPLKFPPHSYYIRQIKRLNHLFHGQPMYVRIFTDYRKPEKIMNQYKERVHAPNIEFDCRKEKNSPKVNILRDFFALTKYDCLIRAESSFSIAAEKIADHKIIIFPLHHFFEEDKLIIDEVKLKVRDKTWVSQKKSGSQ